MRNHSKKLKKLLFVISYLKYFIKMNKNIILLQFNLINLFIFVPFPIPIIKRNFSSASECIWILNFFKGNIYQIEKFDSFF